MIGMLRDAARLVAIIRILARHRALFWIERLPEAPFPGWLARRISQSDAPGRPGERLARAFQDLGPTFIKFGQTLSTRSDVLGDEVAADLAQLQDRLPPFSFEEARQIIEAELEAPLEVLFREFEKEPVAAASIAQVHLAVTADGAPVAVKVLRPGIEQAFGRDLSLFRAIAKTAEKILKPARRLKPVEAVRIFEESIRREMDLRLEAAAATELAENFIDDPRFHVPAIDWQRTSRRVMTLERIKGVRIDDEEKLSKLGHDRRELMRIAVEAFFRQVFVDGFFHADMHPGNVFVREDGSLAVIDFGIMGRLDRRTRRFLADMLLAFLRRDYDAVADVHFRAGYVPAHQSRPMFAQACRSIGEPIFDRPLNEISFGRLLMQLFGITAEFEMETQPQLLLLQKTMLMAEGMGRKLDSSLNMWTLAQPLVEEWMLVNRNPASRIFELAKDATDTVDRLPEVITAVEKLSARLSREHLITITDDSIMSRLWPVWLIAALIATIGWIS